MSKPDSSDPTPHPSPLRKRKRRADDSGGIPSVRVEYDREGRIIGDPADAAPDREPRDEAARLVCRDLLQADKRHFDVFGNELLFDPGEDAWDAEIGFSVVTDVLPPELASLFNDLRGSRYELDLDNTDFSEAGVIADLEKSDLWSDSKTGAEISSLDELNRLADEDRDEDDELEWGESEVASGKWSDASRSSEREIDEEEIERRSRAPQGRGLNFHASEKIMGIGDLPDPIAALGQFGLRISSIPEQIARSGLLSPAEVGSDLITPPKVVRRHHGITSSFEGMKSLYASSTSAGRSGEIQEWNRLIAQMDGGPTLEEVNQGLFSLESLLSEYQSESNGTDTKSATEPSGLRTGPGGSNFNGLVQQPDSRLADVGGDWIDSPSDHSVHEVDPFHVVRIDSQPSGPWDHSHFDPMDFLADKKNIQSTLDRIEKSLALEIRDFSDLGKRRAQGEVIVRGRRKFKHHLIKHTDFDHPLQQQAVKMISLRIKGALNSRDPNQKEHLRWALETDNSGSETSLIRLMSLFTGEPDILADEVRLRLNYYLYLKWVQMTPLRNPSRVHQDLHGYVFHSFGEDHLLALTMVWQQPGIRKSELLRKAEESGVSARRADRAVEELISYADYGRRKKESHSENNSLLPTLERLIQEFKGDDQEGPVRENKIILYQDFGDDMNLYVVGRYGHRVKERFSG